MPGARVKQGQTQRSFASQKEGIFAKVVRVRHRRRQHSIRMINGTHTSGVGKLVLLPLDSVLERLGLSTRLLDPRLHGLGGHIVGALRIHRD